MIRVSERAEAAQEVTGAQLLARSLSSRGVRYVFTAASGRMASLARVLGEEGGLEVVCANSETAAAAMADGYTRRSRRCSVVMTEDRGAALAQVSAVTNAWADKIPIISIALCSDDPPDFNKGVYRERFDQGGVFHPVTLWRERIASAEAIPEAIGEAVRRASAQRMGPVHLDIPPAVLDARVDARHLPPLGPHPSQEARVEPLRMPGDGAAVRTAADLIAGAKRPLLFFGGGINASGAHAQALRFMERWQIPAATTMGGVGAVPVEHPLCLGGPSYAGGETFHVAIQEADVVIAFGTAFGGLEGFGLPPVWSSKIRFIHCDIAPTQLGLNVASEVSILGDARTVLGQLDAALAARGLEPGWARWRKRLGVLKAGRRKRLAWDARHAGGAIHQGRLASDLGELAKRDDPLVVIDGGNTPLYVAMYAPMTKPLQVFFPFGMAALGAGVPYAIGVQLASPDRRVVLVTGDGSFMYNVQELETIKRLALPIVVIVNNDSAWNMIRAMQDMFFARNFVGTDLPETDYSKIARAFGLHATRVTRAQDIVSAYDEAANAGGPALIDYVTDKRNLPDSLLSFTLVEFEGSLKDLSLLKLAKGLWLMKDQGLHRMLYLGSYIAKALLRVNPAAGIEEWR
jgi:acetolactate synthase-1/2/3 large subunit